MNNNNNNIFNNNPSDYSNANNSSNNKLRILSSSKSNLNANQINNLKHIEFNKVDNLKAKLLSGAPDADSLFNSSINKKNLSRNFDSNKIISKNISKKMINNKNIEIENKTHYLNESLQQKNDIMHRSCSNNSFNLNEPLYNSLKRPKVVSKITKGAMLSRNKN